MKAKILVQILLISIIMACSSPSSKKNVPAEPVEVNEWFENGAWRDGITLTPDAAINKEEFYTQYHKRQNLWDRAFEYLVTEDLNSLEVGKYDLLGDSLFAIVSEYETKSLDESSYEAHKKYADIQYLISGEEKMGVIGLDKTEVTIPYDDANDIAFYNAQDENLRMANDKVFFIFFPEDAHRPCMMLDKKGPVKKIVFKVRVD